MKEAYTKMNDGQMKEILAAAIDKDVAKKSGPLGRLHRDFMENHSVEESEDYPGTYIVTYHAPSRDYAILFRESVKSAAHERDAAAGAVLRWKDCTPLATGRRLTEVWVASSDFYA